MNEDLFDLRDSNCPSELALDRLHLAELSDAKAAPIRSHLRDCTSCQARMALRAEGPAAFAQLDRKSVVAAIHTRTAGTEVTEAPPLGVWARIQSFFTLPRLGVAGLALALTVVVVSRAPRDGGSSDGRPPPEVRTKGGVKLQVLAQRGEIAEELVSGDSVYASDRLQLRLQVEKPGHVLVVGYDGKGPLYGALPMGATSSVPRRSGTLQSTELLEVFGAQGRERLFGVWCPNSFTLSELHLNAKAELETPDDCMSGAYDLIRTPNP